MESDQLHPLFAANFNQQSVVDCCWWKNIHTNNDKNENNNVVDPSLLQTWSEATAQWKEYRKAIPEMKKLKRQQQSLRNTYSSNNNGRSSPTTTNSKHHHGGVAPPSKKSRRAKNISMNFDYEEEEDNDNNNHNDNNNNDDFVQDRTSSSSLKTNNNNNTVSSSNKKENAKIIDLLPQPRIPRILKTTLEVEKSSDIENWCQEVIGLTSIISSSSSQNNNNNINDNNNSKYWSFVSNNNNSSSSISKSPASPEAIRWMTVAEKNVESNDWVSAVRNYTNAIQAQSRVRASSSSSWNQQNNNDQNQNLSEFEREAKERMEKSKASNSNSSQQKGSNSSSSSNCNLNDLTAVMTTEEKLIMACLFSNRSACRLGLFDFDGCLEDSNTALSFCSKHPASLARCAQCLMAQPNNNSQNIINSSASSTSSNIGAIEPAIKMLEKCETANTSTHPFLTSFLPSSISSSNNNNKFLFPITTFDTSSLREVAKYMSDFESQRKGGSYISCLDSVNNAATAMCNATCNIDPRFDLLRIQILAASGAYEEAATEASSLNQLAPQLAEAWALRGACVFRATPDGSSANISCQMYRKAAEIYRNLNNDVGRVVCSSQNFNNNNNTNFLQQGAPSRNLPRTSSSSSSSETFSSSFSSSSTTTTTTTPLASQSSKHTSIADSLQKLEKLQMKFSQNFEKQNFGAATQICTEILAMDLLGHRVLRAFTLLRRSMCLVELGSAPRGIEDSSTALELLLLESGSSSSSGKSKEKTSSSENNNNAAADLLLTKNSSFLPFTVAIFATRAICYQKSHSLNRALEDIQNALVVFLELESILEKSKSKNRNKNTKHEENVDDDDDEQKIHLADSFKIIFAKHSEIAKLCNRTTLMERQEYLNSLRFQTSSFSSSSSKNNNNNSTTTNQQPSSQQRSSTSSTTKNKQRDYYREQREKQKRNQEYCKDFNSGKFFHNQNQKQKNSGGGEGEEDFLHSDYDDEDSDEEFEAKKREYYNYDKNSNKSYNYQKNYYQHNNNNNRDVGISQTTHYDTLEISRSADTAAVIKAYRKQSLKYHPDRWSSATEEERKVAEEKFKQVNTAHSVLKDDVARVRYDASLR